MNSQYINPLLTATVNVLTTMAMVEVKVGKPSLKEGTNCLGDITSVIDLKGEKHHGSLAISFSQAAILNIASNMLGESFDTIDEAIADVVGEITNMITGNAKQIYSEGGLDFALATPKTLIGKDTPVAHTVTGATILMPFSTDAGEFYVEVCFN
ncbi:chemotaxis protein CheX [Dasania sp. GY-MA-18]|uniref:Chemotaxis protein CheX n=1 Tax=Dasania phycosphaerae TaxID=2950436 RepID=A0A9J6RHA4_9GAMM|nr:MULTISPECIES: chemotaxis protein CheX [Dasania]MCR8921163.1 chemotaxis protein CheX [Dasania sp. GY-MA-18]MCZ0863591.1 chemotaxis protein CheX [Dasania phycosphaerae]MCZ0867319.1 chemotaxis protein CheX [Dasania phycosphaerae]